GAVAVTREFYFTTVFLSIALSVATLAVYARSLAADAWTAAAGLLMLVGSKAFVDFSTSGLENPLGHLLIVVFMSVYLGAAAVGPATVRRLGVIAALCALTRMDTALLLAPCVLEAAATNGVRRSWRPLLAGAALALIWEGFSLLYYGQPLPNTA